MTAPTLILRSGLPRASGAEAEATRRLLPILASLPVRVEAALGSLGRVGLEVVGPAPVEPAPRQGPAFGIARGGSVGRLIVDGALANRLVARALGIDEGGAASVRRLGLGERGLVAGLIASILQALRAPLAVSISAPSTDELRALRCLALDVAVDVGDLQGRLRLDVPPGWLADAATSSAGARLEGLDFEARVERARTFVPARELEGLAVGDAVVFDGEPARLGDPRAGWPARVVVGAHTAPAELGADGTLAVRGTMQLMAAETPREESKMETEARDRTALLAAAPIEVVAEVGRLALRGDEVLGLRPGAVLTLGPRSTTVALRVGGDVWAEGELVDVEGELGVRVTRLFR
jgi:type III secretion system YscQ/HrcQ family protein